jgi:cell cycle checkpoint protein
VSNLDTASAYIVKRAVQASVALSNKPLDASTSEAAWGGLHTRFNLATEMVPMMIKIQNASGSE